MQIFDDILSLSCATGIGEITEVDEIIKKSLPKNFKVTTLADGTVVATLDGKSDETVLLEAHSDEVGFVVTEVLDDGFLRVRKIGGIDDKILPSMRIKIYGKTPVFGVFTSTPPHLAKGEQKVKKAEELYIDCGTDLKNTVSVGDKAVFFPKPNIYKKRVMGKALDNRISVAVLLECARRVANAVPKYSIAFCFCKNEELGLRGAKTTAFNFNAKAAVVVDTTFGDMPQVPPNKTGNLGDGPMIGISPILSQEVTDRLKACAKDTKVGYEVMNGTTGTDADVISITKSGIATGLISIPIRSMHTPVETADLRDITATADILTKFILGGDNE